MGTRQKLGIAFLLALAGLNLCAATCEAAAKEWRLLGRDIAHRAENCPLARDRNTPLPFTPPEAECADRQALVWETDRDPLDIVLRRTRALADDIACPKECSDALDALVAAAAKTDVQDADARFALFVKVVRLRRKIAFSNPLVKGIDKLLFVGREAFPPDEYNWGVHMCDQFFGFHATQKAASRGDGLCWRGLSRTRPRSGTFSRARPSGRSPRTGTAVGFR